MRAVAAVIDRVDPLQQSLNVNVRHDAPTIEMTAKVLDKIEQLVRRAGVVVPALPAAPIEGEFKVVSEAP